MDERDREIFEGCIKLAEKYKMRLKVPLKISQVSSIMSPFLNVGFYLWAFKGTVIGFILAVGLIKHMKLDIKCADEVLKKEMKQSDVLVLINYVEACFEISQICGAEKIDSVDIGEDEITKLAMLNGVTTFFKEQKGYDAFYETDK
ncbi:uncharacterized protein [Leptinotarsa decemlineata]|uniref:uncharacterized protein n=1 Tax=Leptinotarsa decemlineata TaxID=7539 RepID=UPI003D308652